MGDTCYFRAFKKDTEAVKGYIECWGLYDVDVMAMLQLPLFENDNELVMDRGIQLVELLTENNKYWQYGFTRRDLFFYNWGIQFEGQSTVTMIDGIERGVMYDPEMLRKVISHANTVVDQVKQGYGDRYSNYENEKQDLLKLEQLLERTAQNNGIIGLLLL